MVFELNVTLTRPANTTAYTAGDVIGESSSGSSVITLSGAGRAKGYGGYIQAVNFTSSATPGTMPDIELWVFDAALATVADNAAFAPTDAEMLNHIATIPLTPADNFAGTVNSVWHVDSLAVPYRCVDTTAYAYIVIRDAYTPASAEVFDVKVWVDADV